MESVQARYKIYAPCAVIAEPRCLASKPFEQNPAQAPIPATTFRDVKTLQKFVSAHASIHNHFNLERHLIDRNCFKKRRSAALAEWHQLAA